jgi:hypothetical protein
MTNISQYAVRDLAAPVDSFLKDLSHIVPAESILFWHDASDAATADIVDGKIYRRLDKSIHGRHLAQATPANRPTNVGNLYDNLNTVGAAIRAADCAGIFTTAPVYYVMLCRPGLYGSSPGPFFSARSGNFGISVDCSRVWIGANSTLHWCQYSTRDSILILRVDAGKVSYFTRSTNDTSKLFREIASPVLPLESGDFTVGGITVAGEYLRFYEHFALDGGIDIDILEQAVSYVCHKWGKLLDTFYINNMPPENIYKSTPPFFSIPAVSPTMIDGPQSNLNGDLSADLTGIAVTDDELEIIGGGSTNGSVLANDSGRRALSVIAVNGLAGNVGAPVPGSNGGTFTIAANGTFSFGCSDLASIEISQITSASYTVFDGRLTKIGTVSANVLPIPVINEKDLWTAVDCPGSKSTWLDGNDDSKVTLDVDSVTAWQDKGPLGFSLESRDTFYPTRLTDANSGKKFLRFNGSGMWKNGYYQVSTPLQNKRSMIVAVVCRTRGDQSQTAHDHRFVLSIVPGNSTYSNSNPLAWMRLSNSPGSTREFLYATKFNGDNTSFVKDNTIDIEEAGFHVRLVVVDYAPGGFIPEPDLLLMRLREYDNGALGNTTWAGTGVTSTVYQGVYGSISVGCESGFQSPPTVYASAKIDIAEIFVVAGIDQSEIDNAARKVEGWLAYKWGLVEQLPSDHPHKSAPPLKA